MAIIKTLKESKILAKGRPRQTIYPVTSSDAVIVPNKGKLTDVLSKVAFSNDYNDLDNLPTSFNVEIPTNISAFNNDVGYLTSFTETDPTVPLWAKQSTKPSYNYSEILNTPILATVATSGNYNDLINKPTIPTVPSNVSAFENDAGYLTEHQSLGNYYTKSEINSALGGKQDKLESGTNIKSINGTSVLGSGNITIPSGADGKSAYQSYVDTTTDVPVKTEAEWVASLKGEDGEPGAQGPQGPAGADGADGADGVDLGEVALVQTTGDSEESVMSQKAVTEYGNKLIPGDIDATGEHMRSILSNEDWRFGYYLQNGGDAIANSKYCISGFFQIDDLSNHKVTFHYGFDANAACNIVFYNSNKQRASSSSYLKCSENNELTYTFGNNVSSYVYLRITLNPKQLMDCFIYDNTAEEYIFKGNEFLESYYHNDNLTYDFITQFLLTQDIGNNTHKTMSQKAITKAIKYNMSITNCSCVYMDKAVNFNLTDQQLKAFNSTDIITISFTIMPVLNPAYSTPWRYLRMYGATSLSSTDGFVMNCASSGRMYMQTNNANYESLNAAFNLLNGSIICPAVFNIVWDRVNGFVRFYERTNLVTEKQDDKYKLSQFMRAEKILYFFPADSFSYLYDLQIYDYDIMGILDSDINGRGGASYINPVYDGNLRALDAEWTTSGLGNYGNTAQLPYTFEDGNVIITSTDAAVAGTTNTQRGYYVGTSNIARIYESDIEVVSGTCKINNRISSVINEIVDRNTGTVYAAGDELGVGEYTIKGRASAIGCWLLTYMSGSPMVVKHTANRQKYISCIMHLKCDTIYNGELYDDQADVFYNVPVTPDNTPFNKIQLATNIRPYFAGQMALNGNNVYVGDKNYTWKQINNS